ncbi:cysteine protease XCP1-like protein [Tanacetum coccineum]
MEDTENGNSLVLFEVSVFSAEPDEGKHYNIKAYTNKDDPPEEVWREEWHQCYGERYKNDKKEGPVDGISVEVLFLLSTIIVSSTYAVNTNLLFGIARCRLLRENARQLFLDDIYRNPGPLQFDGPGADSRVLSLCVEDLDYMGRIKKLNEYLEKVRAMVKPGCSQDVVKAALSAMSSVTDILSVMLEIFKDNLKHIDETNKKHSNYWLGLNEFADLSHEEFKNMFLGLKGELPEKREELSEEFTYRNFVDLPKWIGERKELLHPSRTRVHAVAAGHFQRWLQWRDVSERVTISGYHDVPPNNENSFLKALANQPISVAIDASGRDFQFYSGGVFDGHCGTDLDDGVAVVGYGTSKGVDYVTVRNSWGPKWGEKGYIRMREILVKVKEFVASIRWLLILPSKSD